jgi:uncharacterized protein YjeT (DUF2065 family)
MKLHALVIWLAGLFFVLYGIAFAVAPNAMSQLVTGAAVTGVSALVDFRATYGGMIIAVGIAILYLHRIRQVRLSLGFIILVLMLMATTRAIGFAIEGKANTLMYVFFVLELAGSLLAWLAFVTVDKGKT